MAIRPMSPKGAPSVRAAVMPRGKRPVKPGAGRMPGAMPTKPAPRPGVARPAVMPRKQAPNMKAMPVGKVKPTGPNMKAMPVGKSKPGGTAINPIPVVGNKIIKSLPVKPGSKNKLKPLPASKNAGMGQVAQQMKNTTNIKKSQMISKNVSSKNQDIMKALGK